MESTINIIYLSKASLELYLVDIKAQTAKALRSYAFNAQNLSKALQELKKLLEKGRVRLLLADDLAYVMRLRTDDPEKVVHDFIPEDYLPGEWDFKVEPSGKTVIFGIVGDPVRAVLMGLDRLDVQVVAIESIELAKQRNTHPVVGLALKKDLRGERKKELNLEASYDNVEEGSVRTAHKLPFHFPMWAVGLMIAILILILGGLFIRLSAWQRVIILQQDQKYVEVKEQQPQGEI